MGRVTSLLNIMSYHRPRSYILANSISIPPPEKLHPSKLHQHTTNRKATQLIIVGTCDTYLGRGGGSRHDTRPFGILGFVVRSVKPLVGGGVVFNSLLMNSIPAPF